MCSSPLLARVWGGLENVKEFIASRAPLKGFHSSHGDDALSTEESDGNRFIIEALAKFALATKSRTTGRILPRRSGFFPYVNWVALLEG